MRMALLMSLTLGLACTTADARAPADARVIATGAGIVSGVPQNGVTAFLGIPYAAPPIGENRWRAPQPTAPWSGIRIADRFGASCPQKIYSSLGPWTHEYLPDEPTSEDCLTLNVWTPARGRRANLSVLVWIHGGGFLSGSASAPVYDGAALASKGIVVVSLNYRLGFLGWLATPEFRNAGGGNFGLQDQIAALQWVRDNISAFGGDPHRVTIAGQSAGALSVHYLMLSPGARGLFAHAIAQSGTGLGVGFDLSLDTRARAERSAAEFLKAAGVSSIAEARQLPLENLTKAYLKASTNPDIRIRPYADGTVLPFDPRAALEMGRYHDTPVLSGLTGDEGSGLNPGYRLANSASYEAFLNRKYRALAPQLSKLYPIRNGVSPVPALTRDSGIAATVAWGVERARTSRFPMYAYIWTHVEPGLDSARYGAFHTSEVPYVFGTLAKAPDRNLTEDDRRISGIMQDYWVNFVKTGNPNGKGLAVWRTLGESQHLMELGAKFAPYPRLNPASEGLLVGHIRAGGTLFGR